MEEYFDVLDENGVFTTEVASREECHEKGLWHRAVVVFIINSKKQVLLQKRSANKKMWPNLWDISAGGHVLAGEFGFQSVVRETKEELNLDIDVNDLLFIGSTSSINIQGNIKNNHFNEYFIVNKEVDINDLTLQEDEVQDVKWIDGKDVIRRIRNGYENLTDKVGCWEFLEKYLSYIEK